MNLQRDLPRLNYAVITGVIKRRKGINLTRSGAPVIHLLVENTIEIKPDSEETVVSDIQVDLWGAMTSSLDSRLKEGVGILAEGTLTHKKTEDSAGGVHYQTVLKARRIAIITSEKERKA